MGAYLSSLWPDRDRVRCRTPNARAMSRMRVRRFELESSRDAELCHQGDPLINASFDQLRRAVALSHCVPGVGLVVELGSGRRFTVGYDAHSVISTCAMRQALLGGQCQLGRRIPAGIVDIEVFGGLRPVVGDLYRRSEGGDERFLFATTVSQCRVIQLLNEGDDCGIDHSVSISMTVDFEMGVVVPCVAATNPRGVATAGRLARTLHGACIVEELCSSA